MVQGLASSAKGGHVNGACEGYALPRLRCVPIREIEDSGVRIGEDRNIVTLTHAQWNDLVRRVRGGELKPV